MGAEPVQLARNHQQLAGGTEPVDLPGSGVYEQRCSEAAASRGEEISERRQVVAASDAASPPHAERHPVLRRRRLRRAHVAAFT